MPAAAKITFVVKALAVSAALSACSVPDQPTDIHDPYERVNRGTHAVNTGLDQVVLRPASQVYGTVVPTRVRRSLDNAAGNLGLPSAVLNKMLQGNVEDAVTNLFRFTINSTLGVFGLFDPAQDFGLEEKDTDFGETLGTWGFEEGAYVVLPVFGPSTERDTAGRIVDALTNPLSVLTPNIDDERLAGVVVENVNYRYEFTDTVDNILYESADSYAQLRLFYLDSSRFGQDPAASDAALEELYDDLIFAE